jgi:hypothetical protein
MQFDGEAIESAVGRRSAEQKWRPDQTRTISAICAWHAANAEIHVDYEDGQPNDGMRRMIENVVNDTGCSRRDVLSSFGAAHCLMCDVVTGFRPILHSAWDRTPADHHA